MKLERKQIAVVTVLLVAAFFYTSQILAEQKQETLSNRDFIRFHVIANSDTVEDQNLKQKVRDGLLEKIDKELAVYAMQIAAENETEVNLTLEESREYIETHLSGIAEAGENIVRESGYDYLVTADLGARFVPEKSYGPITFPAGEYEALNVVIGSGKGQNWWCVLFPPLCMIGAEAPQEMDVEVLAVYESALWDEKYDALLLASKGKKPTELKLEFKSLNYMKKLKQK